MELNAAVEAARSASHLAVKLRRPIRSTTFHVDSRVVLGYLNYETKRFSRYVSARVDGILKLSSPGQWKYVPSKYNVADLATKGQTPESLSSSLWFEGPQFLKERNSFYPDEVVEHSEDLPESLVDTKNMITSSSPKKELSIVTERVL